MKRSELVTRIEEYLLHTEHLDIPCSLGSDFKAAAEELVILIEKTGMLPPEYLVGYSPMITAYVWEQEDE